MMSIDDTLISGGETVGNRIKACRIARGWSQQELAARSGLSRPSISAIEIGRIVPSVTAALRLAGILGRPVEELFGAGEFGNHPSFAWDRRDDTDGWWIAEVGGALWLYPFEGLEGLTTPIDGSGEAAFSEDRDLHAKARETLVVAGCDPAVGLLARLLAERGVRLLALRRSSGESLELLRAGKVHLAGIHFGKTAVRDENAQMAGESLGAGCRLIRYVDWEEGLIGADHVSLKQPKRLFRQRLRWLGREAGSGIGRMLADFFEDRPMPRRTVPSHWAVATALQAGLADIGAGLRLTAAAARLRFLTLRHASYDLCLHDRNLGDPRIESLFAILHGSVLREQLASLPGYSTKSMGDTKLL